MTASDRSSAVVKFRFWIMFQRPGASCQACLGICWRLKAGSDSAVADTASRKRAIHSDIRSGWLSDSTVPLWRNLIMHPDKKVGLALGILLIGITAAFFFRNDAPSDESPVGQLTTAESLDRRIDRSGSAPYSAAAPSEDRDRTSLPDVPEVAVSDIVPEIPDPDAFDSGQPLPEPLRPESSADVLAPLPKLNEPRDGAFGDKSGRKPGAGVRSLTSAAPETRGEVPRPPGSRPAENAAAETPASKQNASQLAARTSPPIRIHEVVPGDNLSTLAQQYMGSQSHYLKLYEANRDILKSPDDLRVGMRLKIPVTDAETTLPTGVVTPASTPARSAAVETAPRISKKPAGPTFVKPEKSPVVPHGRQTSQAAKSVGQLPPPDLPRVEGLLPETKPAVIASRPDDEN
ncbi:LysM peptidoglycan-binding domain-containing protein [bacterium]|nr:LysM peptidoglycan-binding domain-containing protein [bacterium]